MIKFLKSTPSPKDPTTVAIISPAEAEYDEEAIGDEIWGTPDGVEDGEEYDSPFGCMWPACELVEFDFIPSDVIERIEIIDLQEILNSISLENLIEDLKKLDFIFIFENGDFVEVNPMQINSISLEGFSIQFMEYVSN